MKLSSECGQAVAVAGAGPSCSSSRCTRFALSISRLLLPLALMNCFWFNCVAAGEKPRLIPLVAADSGYSENSSVNILCTVSQGHHDSLLFDWFKDGHLIIDNNHDNELSPAANLFTSQTQVKTATPQIEKHADHSLLRISHVQSHHSGRYTCAAKNQFGQDSSSVNLIVNVKLQWIKEPPKEMMVSLNQELKVDCLAQGEPKPSMRWEKLDSLEQQQGGAKQQQQQQQRMSSHQQHNGAGGYIDSRNQLASNSNGHGRPTGGSLLVSSSRFLNIQRARESDSGIYECIASNSHDQDLRKLVRVQVRAPANFEHKFQVLQAKLGDSARLECAAQGDAPLRIDWYIESANRTALEHSGNEFYDIHETPTAEGLTSALVLRSLSARDSQLYRCQATNEFGPSERLIKLIVSSAPERPANLRVRDVWSRSALVGWSPAPTESSTPTGSPAAAAAHPSARAANYTVQYWRKTASSSQNHRRESLVVDGLQTSALLPNLAPALTYEVSVIAHNSVGQSEPSDTIQVTTSEEEPSAPPTDVQAEAHGASSVRVLWKAPPVETLNGKPLGFYIGYRPRAQTAPLGTGALQPAVQPAPIYSFKTVDASEGQTFYETFLANLKHLTDYELTVRAFNKAGSGPDCHVLVARTGSPRLPGPPTLQVQRVTSSAVSLRWTAPVRGTSQATATALQPPLVQAPPHYELFYQIQGEREWYQLSVASELQAPARANSPGQAHFEPSADLLAGSEPVPLAQVHIHTLSNLQPNLAYRVYVAAANELGLGDPSNVVVVRTNEPSGAAAAYAQADTHLALDSSSATSATGGATSSAAAGLLEALTQPQHGLVYTLVSSAALVAMLVSLVGYFAWQRRLKCKYNSSSASSYPSSWTQAAGASDTIQSEYSIKRLAGSTLVTTGPQLPSLPLASEIYDEVEACEQQRQQQQRARQLHLRNSSATMSGARQLHSSGYQPAGGTLQFAMHSSHAGSTSRHQSRPHANQPGAQHFKTTSATLNRHQNRQLPPIPYSTMGVKEQQRARPISSSQQQVAGQRQATSFAGSQTPLIYGVVE